jgi:hypothetical protein
MVVVLIAVSPAIAFDWNAYEDGRSQGRMEGDPGVAEELRKNREYQQKKDKDAAEQKAEKEATRARESAYKQSKAAHRAKVKKFRKKEAGIANGGGWKHGTSWQLK